MKLLYKRHLIKEYPFKYGRKLIKHQQDIGVNEYQGIVRIT
jgi:hypothetical protein